MNTHNERVDDGTPMDLISNLPVNVIDSIMENLPIRDAVKTSVLSRKWRHMWTTLPRLDFGLAFFENIPISRSEIPNVISEALLQHSGTIDEFILFIHDIYPISFRCLSKWILFLSRRSLKALGLSNWQPHEYEMPSHIFSCKDLVRLELDYFILRPPTDFVGFKSLEQLNMWNVRIESSVLESLISSCPLLERLTISNCVGFNHLKISSPNLKFLIIIEDSRVLKSIRFEGSNNLKDLKVRLKRSVENFEQGRTSNLVNIFSPLLQIKKLHLVHGYIQYLSAGSIPGMLPKMFYSLTFLELRTIDCSEPREISLFCCLLKSYPNLEELKVTAKVLGQRPIRDHFMGLTGSGCSLPRLRTVTIEVPVVFEMALDLVKYLLAVSPSLETLTFKIRPREPDGVKLWKVSQVLLQMERASPKGKIKFI